MTESASSPPTDRLRVAVVGGSGYAGGELLRLLLKHPHVELSQVTSESSDGRYLYQVHPNLRGHTRLRFNSVEQLEPCDVLFLALPHGESARNMYHYVSLADKVIDLSADFRLQDLDLYRRYYGHDHPNPELLRDFVYGIPELHREELRTAHHASGAGCLATTALLGLYPLVDAGVVTSGPVVIEAKVGSSAAGATPGRSSHHPERSGVVRSFAATGHRHAAELAEQLGAAAKRQGNSVGISDLHFSATAVELVRGVLVTAHCFPEPPVSERELWKLYRSYYGDEPFMQIVKERTGVFRYPEPRLLAGTNVCEVGFEVDENTGRIVVIAALDNLVKGAAGNGVQAMNVMCGFDEKAGLDLIGLHP